MRSQLIQNKNADVSLFVNYRIVDNENFEDEESLNSRLSYRQQLLNNAIFFQTVYETSSGTLPQQEFNYIEVDTGLGFYTWNDYNNNNIQELDEFEIAQFQDEANYVRVLLPTINFIKTNQNKFSQSITINPSKWTNQLGVKKLLSHFTNQSFVLIDSKIKRNDDNFDLTVGEVSDRSDGKLVHLDGVNFSRAWSLNYIAKDLPEFAHLKNVANKHINYSLLGIVGDSYEGGHWLGTFAIYALNSVSNE